MLLLGACGGKDGGIPARGDAAPDAQPVGASPSDSGLDVTESAWFDAPADDTGAPDTSVSADSPGDSPDAFTPASILPKLAFWYDPTSLRQSGGLVVRWVDLTQNLNDATQTTPAYQPTYAADGIGGLPSARFDGPIVFFQITDAPSLRWGTGDFLLLAVIRGGAQSATEAMIYQKTGQSPYDGPALYLNADKPIATTLAAGQVSGGTYTVSSPPPATFDDGSVHLLGVRRTGTTLETRVDGAVSASATNAAVRAVDVSSRGIDAMIGQNGYGTPTRGFQQFYGDIAEMIGVGGSLTDSELAGLEQYLKTRYAIP